MLFFNLIFSTVYDTVKKKKTIKDNFYLQKSLKGILKFIKEKSRTFSV